MRLSGHVTLSEENKNAQRIQSENRTRNDRLWRYTNSRKGNIKLAFKLEIILKLEIIWFRTASSYRL
jgi:hypothetical protein